MRKKYEVFTAFILVFFLAEALVFVNAQVTPGFEDSTNKATWMKPDSLMSLFEGKYSNKWGVVIGAGYVSRPWIVDDPVAMPDLTFGIGFGLYSRSGAHFIVEYINGSREVRNEGTFSLMGGGTGEEWDLWRTGIWLFRYRQRIVSCLYASVGGGVFYDKVSRETYPSVIVNYDYPKSTVQLGGTLSLGVDIQVSRTVMMGAQYLFIAGDRGYAIQLSVTIPHDMKFAN